MQEPSFSYVPLQLLLHIIVPMMLRIVVMIIMTCALTIPAVSCDAVDTNQQPQTVVCLGDSITYGYLLTDPLHEAWPALLESKLGEGSSVINLGVSGAMLMNEGGLPYRNTGKIQRAKKQSATMFFIMLGTNDVYTTTWSEDSYYTQLGALVDELAESAPEARMVLMVPPCAFTIDDGASAEPVIEPDVEPIVEPIAASRIGGSIRNIMRTVADEKETDYVDLFAFTESHPEWFPDGLHPNKAGHQAIAEYIFQEVFVDTQ